jgi:hypothetical protein
VGSNRPRTPLYNGGMGRLPENALSELRSPAKALADLVEAFNNLASDHPDLQRLAQMIGHLAEEIALRRSAGEPVAEFGLY